MDYKCFDNLVQALDPEEVLHYKACTSKNLYKKKDIIK